MSFDPTWLLLSIVIGAIGLALFVYGKRQQRWPQLVVGILFMAYPYFTTSVASLLVVGAVLGGGLWYLLRTGR